MKVIEVFEGLPVPSHNCGGAVLNPEKTDSHAPRIDSYDIARALAVLGMMIVNYHVILLEFPRSSSGRFFIDLAETLSGRAAALFVMLAGIGITLMAKNALVSGDSAKLAGVRLKIYKRCLALFLMGHLFWLYWRADILHCYALFLVIGVSLITRSAKVLWLINLVILVISTWIYYVTAGDPDISNLFSFKGLISGSLSELLFSGYYSAFPWLAFMLVGIWFGKRQLLGSTSSLWKIALGALVVFLLSEELLSIGENYFDPDTSMTGVLLLRESFPLSPLYLLSAGSGAILVIIFTMFLSRYRQAMKMLMPLRNVGRLSLTIYVSHVFVAYLFAHIFEPRLSKDDYVSAALIFLMLSYLFYFAFANFWCRRFQNGPLEWIMRMASNLGGVKQN